MRRVKVILASLMPALWLVASVSCLFDPASCDGAGGWLACSVAQNGECSHGPSSPECVLEQSARRWLRRLSDDSAALGIAASASISRFQVATRDDFTGLSEYPRLPWELAQRWQFYLRTAPDVRAPSSIS